MKVKSILICLLLASVSYVCHSVYGDMKKPDLESFLLSDVEALAGDTEGSTAEYINCFCSEVSDQVCSAAARGLKCHADYGAKCWEYNANCAH